jgi:hypothetical protein
LKPLTIAVILHQFFKRLHLLYLVMHKAVILALDLEIDISELSWLLSCRSKRELSWLLSCRSNRSTRLLCVSSWAACTGLAPRHHNEDVKRLSGGLSLKLSGGLSLTQDSRLSESPPVAGPFSAAQKWLDLSDWRQIRVLMSC